MFHRPPSLRFLPFPARNFLLVLALASTLGTSLATEAEVRAAVENYFAAWSRADMDAYAATFHPEAVIFFLKPDGSVGMRAPVAPFVASQAEAHRTSPERMSEVPRGCEVTLNGTLATAVVPWKLTAGARVDTGVDVFTFVRGRDGWKILTLVFNNDETPRETR